MKLKFSFCAVILSISSLAASQQDFRQQPSWYLGGFVGQTGSFLGSKDIRRGGGINVAHEMPERRFRWGSTRAKLVTELYIDRSYSLNKTISPNTEDGGFLVMGRWFGRHDKSGQGFFASAGWGLQYANRKTTDLNSTWNSTPVLEVGTTLPMGNQEFAVGLRYLHASNAGLAGGGNRGSNRLLLTFGVRF